MRNSYMTDFQGNLEHNTSRKDERITEVNGEIEMAQKELEKSQKKKADLMQSLSECFKKRKRQLAERKMYFIWRNLFMENHFIRNKADYAARKLKSVRQRRLFDSWRYVTHNWFKERIDSNSSRFRNTLKK